MISERATADDICELTRLRKAYLLEDYGSLPGETIKMIEDSLPGYFHSHLDRDIFAFVCRDGGHIVSCCLLYVSKKPANPSFVSGRTGTVMNVYTEPEYRRKGIAGGLVRLLLAEAENLGLDYVELKATDSGYGLYKSLGFEDTVSKYHDMKYIISGR